MWQIARVINSIRVLSDAPLLATTSGWSSVDDGMIRVISVAVACLVALGLAIGAARLLGVLAQSGHLPPVMAIRLRRTFWWLMVAVVAATFLQGTHLFDQAWAVLSGMLLALAVAFVALWSVLSNAVCALLILAFRPFRVGDLVEILEPGDRKQGVKGRVGELSLMFTTLELELEEGKQTVYRVPNSIFFQKGLAVTFDRPQDHDTFFHVP